MKLTKFQKIALPLIARGLKVTPVRPDGKAAATRNFGKWQYRTEEQVMTKYVEKFADKNGGVVSYRGRGNPVFVDNDGGIPKAILDTQPRTFTVATRPDGEHQHLYFYQTEYSLKQFGTKNFNVRDIAVIVESPSGGKMYKTLFDVKGCGGAALVVAPGSTRRDGSVYIVIDDSPIIDIPDSFVDWLCEQRTKWLIASRRELRKKFAAKKRAARKPPEERERLRLLGDDDGFDIFEIDRHYFLLSRAMKFARLGVLGDDLTALLAKQVSRHVPNGVKFCQSSEGMEKIRAAARLAERRTTKTRAEEMLNFYSKKNRRYFMEGTTIYDMEEVPTQSRREIFREVIGEFENVISREDADRELAARIELAGLAPYDKRKDKNAVSAIRKELGFEVGPRNWIRHQLDDEGQEHQPHLGRLSIVHKDHPISPSTLTGVGTGHVPLSSSCEGDTFE